MQVRAAVAVKAADKNCRMRSVWVLQVAADEAAPKCLEIHRALNVVFVHGVVLFVDWVCKKRVQLVTIKSLQCLPHLMKSLWNGFFQQCRPYLHMSPVSPLSKALASLQARAILYVSLAFPLQNELRSTSSLHAIPPHILVCLTKGQSLELLGVQWQAER